MHNQSPGEKVTCDDRVGGSNNEQVAAGKRGNFGKIFPSTHGQRSSSYSNSSIEGF